MCNMQRVSASRTLSRVVASAALHRCNDRAQGDTSRPPASERLAPGPRRARPATCHAPQTLPYTADATATPRATTYPRLRAAAGSRTTRLSMYSMRCVLWQAREGAAARTSAGSRSCALRHASVSTFSCVLPQPAARHLQRSPCRAPRCLQRSAPHIATVLMPSNKL